MGESENASIMTANKVRDDENKNNHAWVVIADDVTFKTPMTAVLRTYALTSPRHFCKGASTYSSIETRRRLHSDLRASPRTIGSSSSL